MANNGRRRNLTQFQLSGANKAKLVICDHTIDITYIWTEEGWLYLTVFIDLFSRMVVGWAISERMTADLVVSAFEMGQKRRGARVSPLVHSDQGSQYAITIFRQRLEEDFCLQSMSRRGQCWDNAVAESFFSLLKMEIVDNER